MASLPAMALADSEKFCGSVMVTLLPVVPSVMEMGLLPVLVVGWSVVCVVVLVASVVCVVVVVVSPV